MFSRFVRIHEHDRQTDAAWLHKPCLCVASRDKKTRPKNADTMYPCSKRTGCSQRVVSALSVRLGDHESVHCIGAPQNTADISRRTLALTRRRVDRYRVPRQTYICTRNFVDAKFSVIISTKFPSQFHVHSISIHSFFTYSGNNRKFTGFLRQNRIAALTSATEIKILFW